MTFLHVNSWIDRPFDSHPLVHHHQTPTIFFVEFCHAHQRQAQSPLCHFGLCASQLEINSLDHHHHHHSVAQHSAYISITMSENVGLSTPRGSGTSGYVQRNLAQMRPRDRAAPYPPKDSDSFRHAQRQPDKGILEHDRKRDVEVKVFELRDQLEEEE